VEHFVRWGSGWLARERVTDPLLYPLPISTGTAASAAGSSLTALADALARHIGPAASVRSIVRQVPNANRQAQGGHGAPSALVDELILTGEVGRGAPILLGDIYDADLLRAAALKLNDAGSKPMHALYAARIDAAPTTDPFDVRNESFSVR
jgi:hypothetical protein